MHLLHPQAQEIFAQIELEDRVKRYLNPLREHHEETYHHVRRVAQLCVDIGYDNTLKEEQLRYLAYGGLLHDLGKRCVPYNLLSKNARLTPEEIVIMDGHARLGFVQLQQFEYAVIPKIVVAHHEYQRRGYPRKGQDRRVCERRKIVVSDVPDNRRGQDRRRTQRRQTDAAVITLAQLLAAADVFDALSQPRAYKPALPLDKIQEIFTQDYLGARVFAEQVMRRYAPIPKDTNKDKNSCVL